MLAMWPRRWVVSLISLLFTLPTTLLKDHKELEAVNARRLAELRRQLMMDNYDYESSDTNREADAPRRVQNAHHEPYVITDALNQNLNRQLLGIVNHISTTSRSKNTSHPPQISQSSNQLHQRINHSPTPRLLSTTPRSASTPSPPMLDWEPDEVFADHDLITPFHRHSTIATKWRIRSSKPVDDEKSHHDQLNDVKRLFDQTTRDSHRQQSNVEIGNQFGGGFQVRAKHVGDDKKDHNTTKTATMKNNSKHHQSSERPKPSKEPIKTSIRNHHMVSHITRSSTPGYVSAEYSMTPMDEETNASLSSAINTVYILQKRDDGVIIPTKIPKRGLVRPAGSGNVVPDHVISKTDLLYYMDDARLAPPSHFREGVKAKPLFHADTAVEYNDSPVTPAHKVYKVLKLSGPSARRARGPLSGAGSRTFIQEEGAEGVVIAKVDSAPFPEFRLPRARRQYMHASDQASSESSELVE